MEQISTPLEQLIEFLPYLIPVILLELILLIVAVVDLIRRENVCYLPKWAWALIVVFIQIIGPIVYFIIGREE
jgi:hypothetical protein